MSFIIQCPSCSCSLQLEDGTNNASFNCPQCSQLVTLANGMVQAPGMPAMNNAFAQQRMYKTPPRHLQVFPNGKRPWTKPSYKLLTTVFMIWMISGIATLLLGVLGTVLMLIGAASGTFLSIVGIILGVMAILTLVIFLGAHMTLLYNYWRLIPPERARTTPDMAVGFLCIPVFQLFWNFVAYYELGKDMERELGNTTQASTMGLVCAIASVVTILLSWVPFLCIVVYLVFFGILLLTMINFQKTAKMLLAKM